MRILEAIGGGYYVVLSQDGKLVAQGRRAMCELIAAGRRVLTKQGELFEQT